MYLSIFFLALALFLFPQGVAHADVSTILYIQGPGGTVLANTSLVVPAACSVQDSTGAAHTFTGHKAPCALQTAKDTGVIADFLFKDFGGLGLFLDRVNGIASGPAPDYPYWNLWRNGVFSDVGINEIVLASGDTFQLTYGPWITGIVYPTQDVRGGGPVVNGPLPAEFDTENAVLFLVKNQNEDGSFKSSPLLTDWAGVALGAYEGYSATAETAKRALKEYLLQDPSPGTFLTDKLRRAMALQALGISPYEGTKTNYIAQILREFDGTQFGSPDLVNDDIFALLVLRKAGYGQAEEIVRKTAEFVFSWQKEDGSWGTVDMTGAALQALSAAGASTDERLLRARGYLISQETEPGSFGNVYATSWALQGLAALQEPIRTSWLAQTQALDGGLREGDSLTNRIWATSYAIPAALGKDWGKILVAFEKPGLDLILAAEIQSQLEAIDQEVRALTLEVVAFALQEITARIAALEPRVLAFVESQERAFAFVPQAQVLVQPEKVLPEPEEILVTAEPLQAEQLIAAVGVREFPLKALVPYVVGAGVLAFLLFGNPSAVLSFLRGKLKLTP